jgi:gas vesicle protein
MEINDYSQRLAQARNRFSEASQEQRDNYQSNLESLEKNHETREKSQRENYVKQKLEMEDRSADRLKRYDKNLKSALNERTERYTKDIEAKRENFEKSRRKQMDDYNQKLFTISKSFDTANTEKDKLHAMYKDNISERYDDGLAAREKNFNEKLASTQKSSEEKINKFRDEQTKEKKQMLVEHSAEKKQLVQDANITRNKSNSRHQLDMEMLRENAKQKENTLLNNFENANANLRVTKNQENEAQRDTFEKLTSEIYEKNSDEFKDAQRKNKADKRLLEKSFARDRIQLERKTNQLLNDGSSDKVERTRKALVNQYEKRIDSLQNNIEENNYNNSLRSEKMALDFADENKTAEIMHNRDLDKKDSEMRELRKEVIGGLKERFDNYQELTNQKLKTTEMAKEQGEVEAKQKLSSNLARQRAEFGRTVNKINDANKQAISDIQNEVAKEQTNFYQKTKRDVHNQMEDLKSDLNSVHAKKEDSLAKQILSKEQENNKLIDKYETKLSVLKAKSAKELEHLKVFESERRAEDRRATQRAMAQKQREFDKNLQAVRTDYEGRLDSAKANADLHVSKLTERYEGELIRQRNDSNKELQRTVALMKANYNKLADKSELEKETIVNQYELKMNKLREANRVASEVQTTRTKEA